MADPFGSLNQPVGIVVRGSCRLIVRSRAHRIYLIEAGSVRVINNRRGGRQMISIPEPPRTAPLRTKYNATH